MYECFACVCVCTSCECLVPMGERRGQRVLYERNHRQLWANVRVLGTKPRLSVRAASALNCCAISPAPLWPCKQLLKPCMHGCWWNRINCGFAGKQTNKQAFLCGFTEMDWGLMSWICWGELFVTHRKLQSHFPCRCSLLLRCHLPAKGKIHYCSINISGPAGQLPCLPPDGNRQARWPTSPIRQVCVHLTRAHVSVCACVYAHVCSCAHMCGFVCSHIYVFVYVYVCMCVSVSVCINVHTHVCICLCVCSFSSFSHWAPSVNSLKGKCCILCSSQKEPAVCFCVCLALHKPALQTVMIEIRNRQERWITKGNWCFLLTFTKRLVKSWFQPGFPRTFQLLGFVNLLGLYTLLKGGRPVQWPTGWTCRNS